jgi:hypothetical protein
MRRDELGKTLDAGGDWGRWSEAPDQRDDEDNRALRTDIADAARVTRGHSMGYEMCISMPTFGLSHDVSNRRNRSNAVVLNIASEPVQTNSGKTASQNTSVTVESNVDSDIVEATSDSSQWCSLDKI